MEDSKIIWYIVLGAIYFLSKAFGKKKKPVEEQAPYAEDENYEPESPSQKQKPSSFDDILKELSKEIIPTEPDPLPKEIEEEEFKPLVSETTPLPSHTPKTEYELKVEAANQLPSKAPIEREKPVYARNEKFVIEEEENEIAQELHDILSEEDGPKKALILTEVFNRRY